MDVLNYASDYIIGYGGHVGAAGLSVAEDKIDGFIDKVNEYSEKFLKEKSFHPIAEIEMEIFTNEINIDSYEQVKKLEPFGTSTNAEPIFVCRDMIIKNIKKIGKNEPKEHISLTLTSKDSNIQIKAVGFFIASYFDLLYEGDKIDISFKLNKNEYMGTSTIQMMIDDIFFDIRKDDTFVKLKNEENNIDSYISKYSKIDIDNITYINVYKSIKKTVERDKYKVIVMDKIFLRSIVATDTLTNIDYITFSIILDALKEAGFLNISDLGYGNIGVSLKYDAEKRKKISETKRFKSIN